MSILHMHVDKLLRCTVSMVYFCTVDMVGNCDIEQALYHVQGKK